MSKINKVSSKLNKKILSIVIGYNRIKYKMLWCELSKKKSQVTKIEMRRNGANVKIGKNQTINALFLSLFQP